MKSKNLFIYILCVIFSVSCSDWKFGDVAIDEKSTDSQKESYALGAIVGKQIGKDFAQIDFDLFITAFKKSIKKEKLHFSDTEINSILMAARERVVKSAQKKLAADVKLNTKAGVEFLAKNAVKKGVKTTESGLQYQVITAGVGKPIVKKGDKVKVHYRGTLVDGTEFDSSYSRKTPTEFVIDGVISGWQEGLKMMPIGAKWKLFIPANLAYGERNVGKIGPNQALIFEVELLDVNGKFSSKKTSKQESKDKKAKLRKK